MSTAAAATMRFAVDAPIASPSVSMPIPSSSCRRAGLNGRSNAVKNPMSRTFTSTSTLRITPSTTTSTRRGRGGQQDGHGDDDQELEREP